MRQNAVGIPHKKVFRGKTFKIGNAEQFENRSASIEKTCLLHAVLIGLDHFLDHLAADRTGLAAGEFAVVTVLQVDADLGRGLHLELIHREFDSKTAGKTRKGAWRLYFFVKAEKKYLHNVT